MRRRVIMGNWKLNGNKPLVADLLKALNAMQPVRNSSNNIDVVVAPPTIYLDWAQRCLSDVSSSIRLGAQNSDSENQGAFTGDIAPEMLKEMGVSHVIIGHSERRAYHEESDEIIAKKFAALKNSGLIPVLCIGETEAQNTAGETVTVCAHQLDAVIAHNGIDALNNSIIAYEPIWAIGTGKAATAEQAQQIHQAIRQHIARYSEAVAKNVTIQYGGSVNAENAQGFFTQPDIDGALVGGASLKAADFSAIIEAAARVG